MNIKQIVFAFILIATITSCQNKITKEDKNDISTISNKEIDQKVLNKELAKTNEIWDSLSKQLRNKDLNKSQQDSLQELFNQNKKDQELIFKNFIRQNPNSLVSVESLNGFKFNWGKDTTEKLFKTLIPAIQFSEKGELVQDYIQYYRNPMISDHYSDFRLPNSNGDTIKISKVLSNYTLLEFWASWCSGCRKEHPELIEVYEKYQGKNFTVIGVSSDSSEEDWHSAINKDNLPWMNLRDSNGRESIVQYQYGIHFVPTNFLIGPDKTIIAKDINPRDLDKLLEKELGETAHNNV